MKGPEYAREVGARLARNTVKKYIEEWAKNRVPPAKGEAKHLFCHSTVRLSADKEGNKLINGVPVSDFWKHIPEADAMLLLIGRPYLERGKCTWQELWHAYTNI